MNDERRKRLLTAVCVFVSLPVLVTSAEECAVTGRVVDYLARPVAGAEVAIYERVHDYSIDHYVAVLGDEIRRTDRDGRFALTADVTLSPIRVNMIVVRKEGHALAWDWLSYLDDNVIVLERPSSIRGVVVDAQGHPVAKARVRAAPKSSYLMRLEQMPVLAPESWLTTETDDQGGFAFGCFSADVRTDFWVAAPGWAQVYQFTTNMMSVCGFEVGRTDIRLVLPQEVPLRGTVVDGDSGDPVAGAAVMLHPKNIDHDKAPFIPTMTTSGPDGRFEFDGVPLGQRRLQVSAPLETGLVDRRVNFDVTAGAGPKEVTAELQRGGRIELAAREQNTGQPIPNLMVSLGQASPDGQSDFYKTVPTDANGTLRGNAPVGECAFSTRCDSHSPMFHDDQVQVLRERTARAEIILDRNPHVSGFVIDEAGQPVAGTIISGVTGQTDQAGAFETRLSQDGLLPAWVVRHVQRNLATVARFDDIEPSPKITLQRALSVSGRVTDPSGKGIPAACVELALQIPGVIMAYAPEVVTDSDGCFEIAAVARERDDLSYRLSVHACGYGRLEHERISVEAGSDGRVEIEPVVLLPADRSVTGVVVDAGGTPVPGLPVHVSGDNQPTRSTVTDSAGRFAAQRMCQGSLRIQVSYGDDAGFLEAEGGDHDVTVILGQRGVHLRYASLMGKPLPDSGELGLDLAGAEFQGKRVLLCFFDCQQRPSRNALLQLARQVDALAQEGVVVIAVQASAIEPAALKTWTEKVDLTVPVGAIADDVETIRLAWGVRSLPWLILTDAEHRVAAEGLSLAEVERRIGVVETDEE